MFERDPLVRKSSLLSTRNFWLYRPPGLLVTPVLR